MATVTGLNLSSDGNRLKRCTHTYMSCHDGHVSDRSGT